MDTRLKELYEFLMASTGQCTYGGMIDGAAILRHTSIDKKDLDGLLKKLCSEKAIKCSTLTEADNKTFGKIKIYKIEILKKNYKPSKSEEVKLEMKKIADEATERQLKPTKILDTYMQEADETAAEQENTKTPLHFLRPRLAYKIAWVVSIYALIRSLTLIFSKTAGAAKFLMLIVAIAFMAIDVIRARMYREELRIFNLYHDNDTQI